MTNQRKNSDYPWIKELFSSVDGRYPCNNLCCGQVIKVNSNKMFEGNYEHHKIRFRLVCGVFKDSAGNVEALDLLDLSSREYNGYQISFAGETKKNYAIPKFRNLSYTSEAYLGCVHDPNDSNTYPVLEKPVMMHLMALRAQHLLTADWTSTREASVDYEALVDHEGGLTYEGLMLPIEKVSHLSNCVQEGGLSEYYDILLEDEFQNRLPEGYTAEDMALCVAVAHECGAKKIPPFNEWRDFVNLDREAVLEPSHPAL